jgi:hypothetical protein
MYAHMRETVFVLALLAALVFQPGTVRGNEVVADSVSATEIKSSRLSLLLRLGAGYGNYENIIRQEGGLSSPVEIDSRARTYDGEIGLQVLSFRVSLDLSFPTTLDYIADDDSTQEAYSSKERIKGVYALRKGRYHLFPEVGYVFVAEDALIFYMLSERPIYHKESYKDQGFYYGLSARVRIAPCLTEACWLYAHYTHDNLDIAADNYQLELQVGGGESGAPGPDGVASVTEFSYVGLGVKWSKKADGRSEWFIILGLSGAFRLL